MSMLRVSSHPLVQHRLAELRAEGTPPATFRRLVRELTLLLMVDSTAALATRPVTVATPLASCRCRQLARPAVLVPILRAGLGMLEGALELLPEARVGHLGMARNEHTLQPNAYYSKIPPEIGGADTFVLDPMLATGGSASAALTRLKEAGATSLVLVCLVAAPEGVAKLAADHPEVTVFTAALDERLNDRGYILPGLGDAGDRLFNTVED